MLNLENNLKSKKIFGKIAFYIILGVFFFIPYKNISAIMKPFILSYFITNIFLMSYECILKYLSKRRHIRILNFIVDFIISIIVVICFLYLAYVFYFFFIEKKPEKIIFFNEIFSLLFFLLIGIIFLIPHIKRSIPLRIFKFDFEKKMMLASYIVYTVILIFIKYYLNGIIIKIEKSFFINIEYIKYQLIVCTVYLNRLKNMYSLTLIGGTKEHIEKFEQIIENNKTKINYDGNKKLIEDWKRYLAEDNPELENTIKGLSNINKKFFKEEIIKLNKKVEILLNGNKFIGTKKQKRDLESIIERKINKNEAPVLEFLLYKTDIEEIIDEIDKNRKYVITILLFVLYKSDIGKKFDETDSWERRKNNYLEKKKKER